MGFASRREGSQPPPVHAEVIAGLQGSELLKTVEKDLEAEATMMGLALEAFHFSIKHEKVTLVIRALMGQTSLKHCEDIARYAQLLLEKYQSAHRFSIEVTSAGVRRTLKTPEDVLHHACNRFIWIRWKKNPREHASSLEKGDVQTRHEGASAASKNHISVGIVRDVRDQYISWEVLSTKALNAAKGASLLKTKRGTLFSCAEFVWSDVDLAYTDDIDEQAWKKRLGLTAASKA